VADEVFVRMESYPDEMTHGLVAAASNVLGEPAERLLQEFGRYWMRYTMIEGYGALLYDLGLTLHDAMSALDGMHARVTLPISGQWRPSCSRCRRHPTMSRGAACIALAASASRSIRRTVMMLKS
jgi:hypothetical protein